VLLGQQITFADLEALDEAEAASLRALMGTRLEEGTVFETFELSFGTSSRDHGGSGSGGAPDDGRASNSGAGIGAAGGSVRLVPAGPHKRVRRACALVALVCCSTLP
jgi:hypothetical protein